MSDAPQGESASHEPPATTSGEASEGASFFKKVSIFGGATGIIFMVVGFVLFLGCGALLIFGNFIFGILSAFFPPIGICSCCTCCLAPLGIVIGVLLIILGFILLIVGGTGTVVSS